MPTLTFARRPVDAAQQDTLEKLFAHPGFSLLKEVVAAHALERQVSAMDAMLYENETAATKLKEDLEQSRILNGCLEILTELEKRDTTKPEDCWFTAQLEHLR